MSQTREEEEFVNMGLKVCQQVNLRIRESPKEVINTIICAISILPPNCKNIESEKLTVNNKQNLIIDNPIFSIIFI